MDGSPPASQVEVTSAVFIDIPNVDSVRAHHDAVRWEALIDHIDLNHILDTYPVHAGAYAKVSQGATLVAGELTRLRRRLNKLQFDTFARVGDDIDSWIINDIWRSVVRTERLIAERDEVLTLPLRMRHVLVSGDAGYLRAYDTLEETYHDELELELVVYSWERRLSNRLRARATEVVLLDEVLDFDTMAAFMSRRSDA